MYRRQFLSVLIKCSKIACRQLITSTKCDQICNVVVRLLTYLRRRSQLLSFDTVRCVVTEDAEWPRILTKQSFCQCGFWTGTSEDDDTECRDM
jgi:hypothetical protein